MISLDLYRTTSEGREWVGTFVDLDVAKAKPRYELRSSAVTTAFFDPSTGSGFSTKTVQPDRPSARIGGMSIGPIA